MPGTPRLLQQHNTLHRNNPKPLTTRIYKWIVRLLVGPNGESTCSKNYNDDDRHREQSQKAGVFREIWPNTPVYLDPRLETLLRETDEQSILTAPRPWCLRWWRTCKKKVSQNVRIAQLRNQILEWRRQLQQPGARIIIDRGKHRFIIRTCVLACTSLPRCGLRVLVP